MSKIKISFGILALLLVGSVSAISVDYYFNTECGHCEKIAPFINEISNKNSNVKWNFLDTSKGSYAISGTPTLILKTDDGREIKMIGSYEIPRYLECEINEQSNLNCPTYSASECRNDSWFIKE